MSTSRTGLPATAVQHIHFVVGPPPASSSSNALLRFADPVESYAVRGAPHDGPMVDAVSITVFPWGEAPENFAIWAQRVQGPGGVPPLFLKARGVELWWHPGKAVLQCDADEADALVTAVAEFEWYERALRGLEVEIAAGWHALEFDKTLAFDVTAADLRGSHALGARMGEAFQRRIHFARLEPHLYMADATLTAAAQKLGNDLREKAFFESRAEAMDAHLEVFEHIYEMASQRMGEFRAAHGSNRVEWIIIWLLIAEVSLSLAQVILKR